nr:hypothetical protein Iba_chr06aCG8840 [Ipomoea batatas]
MDDRRRAASGWLWSSFCPQGSPREPIKGGFGKGTQAQIRRREAKHHWAEPGQRIGFLRANDGDLWLRYQFKRKMINKQHGNQTVIVSDQIKLIPDHP